MEVIVLNTDFESVILLDTFKSLVWADRYDAYGDFEMTFAMDTALLEFLKENYYLWIKESEHCMIIEKIAIDCDVESGNTLTISGRSLESILDRRIVWDSTTLSGNLQNGIKMLVNNNIISASDTRKIENFSFVESTDTSVTELTIDTEYADDDMRGEELYFIISKLCKENNIGFRVVLNESNKFVFSLYAGVDRSFRQSENPYVIFSSSFDNVLNCNYYRSVEKLKNAALVVGEKYSSSGSSTSLTSTITDGSPTGLDRREIYINATNVSNTTDLQSEGKKTLAENKMITAFEGEINIEQPFKYGQDFFIGDIVQITDDYGNESSVRITEIVMSEENGFVSVTPTFEQVVDLEVNEE